MSVESLRASRNRAVAVFVQFSRLYKEFESALYCFFEGDDSKYYGIRIKNIIRPEKYIDISCNGKEGVLGIHRMLSARKYYSSVKAAYFIDRDFDKSIYETGLTQIYETPCYSVENFYTSVDCFSEILKAEFKLTELDDNFTRSISLYMKLQDEFHNAVESLNVWIACQRDNKSVLNISDLSVLRFIDIDLDKITIKYTISDLYTMYPKTCCISQDELDVKRSELQASNRQTSFRGKFEIEFLFSFLQKLISEANQGNYPYFTKKIKVFLSLSKKNMISDLSQYADTPDSLYSYLESFKTSS
ncbi:hypothetical protein NIES4071_97040 [Calothrix sp. NIES-4071]|nr:hypothetical protein NIES4071_97040 [Calothrix sp. NIES-4071]BAZ63969.1 hypothetical protein NIES4105_96970 [Calothrix sp. NIES-4105]